MSLLRITVPIPYRIQELSKTRTLVSDQIRSEASRNLLRDNCGVAPSTKKILEAEFGIANFVWLVLIDATERPL